jgi:hypothetical protein
MRIAELLTIVCSPFAEDRRSAAEWEDTRNLTGSCSGAGMVFDRSSGEPRATPPKSIPAREYKILVCVGGVGTLTGCLYALNRRKSVGVSHPEVDEWKQFIGTAGFYLLAAIVLVGSLGIAVLAALIFDDVIRGPA